MVMAVDPATDWLEREAAPAIRRGIISVARHGLAAETFDQWDEPWQEAFQNAAIQLLCSRTAQRLANDGQWEDLRAYAARAGANAATDQLRLSAVVARHHVPETDGEAQENPPAQHTLSPAQEEPEQRMLAVERQREQRSLLERVRALLPELSYNPAHPQRKILGYYLHLLDQEIACLDADPQGPDEYAQAARHLWRDWVHDLLGDGADLPAHRESRYDMQIACIMRPTEMQGELATDAVRKQAAQWVRTELSRARKQLRASYERQYGTPPTW